MEEKEINFEEALKNLQEVVSKLENNQIKLDEAYKAFEDGVKYVKICEKILTDVEEKISKIVKNNKEEDFTVEPNE